MFRRVRRFAMARRTRESPVGAELAPRVAEVERRLAHLESALEGLQDSVHRESVRRNDEAARMQRKTEPGEMARALSDDARERGL